MNKALRLSLSALAALALLGLLMVWGGVSPAQVWATLRALPAWMFAAAVGMHFTVYCLRSVRFRSLIPADRRPGFWPMMAVSASHNLVAYVLPAKAGEASYFLYLKGVCGVSGATGLASLVAARLYDFTVMCGALGLATLWIGHSAAWSPPAWTVWPIAGAFLAAGTLFGLLALRGERVMGPLRLFLRTTRLDRTRAGRKLYEFTVRTSEALRLARGGVSVPAQLLLTALIWLGVFGFFAMLGRGFGLPEHIGPAEAIFGAGLAGMSNVLPLNFFAGMGTQEAGWVLGFSVLGVDRDLAFATGLAAHLVQLFNVGLFGILGHVGMGLLPSHALPESREAAAAAAPGDPSGPPSAG